MHQSFFGLPNHRIGYLFASKDLIKIYDEISIPFPFSDLSANVFINAIKDYKKIEKTRKKVIKANKEIYRNLKKENYIFTSERTPIFTLRTNKKLNLMKELLKRDIKSESGNNFVNLDDSFTRIRINGKYKKLIEKICNKSI